MIGKLIRMKSRRARAPIDRTKHLGRTVFALTSYIVDADPYSLVETTDHGVLSITDYALAIEAAGIEPGEKVAAFGARNLVGDDLVTWQAQMLSVAARASMVKTPVLHIILSLHEGETWTANQRNEAIDITLTTLGLERCQCVWSEHSNTVNPHLHLCAIRVDPATGKAAGTDWLIDDLHQALSLIEERHKRKREPDALYIARDGVVFDAESGTMVRDRNGTYISGWYKTIGKKHERLPKNLRRLRADLIDATASAQTWADLHEAFSEANTTYDRSGSGARIAHDGVSTKASNLHASLSRSSLEKRLGPFEPDISRLDPGFEAYRYALDSQLAELRSLREQECARIDAWVAAITDSIFPRAGNLLHPAILAEASAARDSLHAAFSTAIGQCTQQRFSADRWISAGRPAYRRLSTPALVLPAEINGSEHADLPALDLPTHDVGWATQYFDDSGVLLFTDHRIAIVVHQTEENQAIDGALHLAAARWGTVTVRGPDPFVALVAARAAVLDISVIGADGQPLVVENKSIATTQLPSADEKPMSSWQAPNPEEDLQRQVRIEASLKFLRSHRGLPLRRKQEPDDDGQTGRRGPLEIVVVGNGHGEATSQRLKLESVFDQDQRVQAFLEDHRKQMLAKVRRLLLQTEVERLPDGSEELLDLLPNKEESRHPTWLALADHDFMLMLQDVREQMLQRRNVRHIRHRNPRPVNDKGDRAQSNDLAAETERAGGLSVEQLAAYLNDRGRRR